MSDQQQLAERSLDEQWMRRALLLADRAAAEGEVPVGAVLVDAQGECIGEGWNQVISNNDPSAHAEMVALRAAAQRLSNYRLPDCTLYVTIEPCTMCAGALVHSRIKRLVIAAREPKAGAVVSHAQLLDADYCNHRVMFEEGVLGEEASEKISRFFRERRAAKRALKTDSAGESER